MLGALWLYISKIIQLNKKYLDTYYVPSHVLDLE